MYYYPPGVCNVPWTLFFWMYNKKYLDFHTKYWQLLFNHSKKRSKDLVKDKTSIWETGCDILLLHSVEKTHYMTLRLWFNISPDKRARVWVIYMVRWIWGINFSICIFRRVWPTTPLKEGELRNNAHSSQFKRKTRRRTTVRNSDLA